MFQFQLLQGLKPNIGLLGFFGPTKVRPWLQCLAMFTAKGFSAACEIVPFQKSHLLDRFQVTLLLKRPGTR